MEEVLEGVLTTMSRYNMLAPGSRVIAAVSGGADSVCLLHVLAALGPKMGFQLVGVAHFNHQLRGAESEEDERFVAQQARDLGLPLYLGVADGAPEADNLEQHLRRLRREFFSSLIAEGKADRIALGHTRDDQAETVLFRLMRGSGLAGMAGILPVTAEGLIRPLLGSTRAEVEQFLLDRRIPWREDASNRDPRFARNRIRHRLLPQLEREWNPRLREALAHLADLAYEEERWWAQQTGSAARSFLHPTPHGIEMQARELSALPRAQARRLVREAIREAKGNPRGIEFRHVEAVLDLAGSPSGSRRSSASADLPGLRAIQSFDWILLQRAQPRGQPAPTPPTEVPGPGQYPSPDCNTMIRLGILLEVSPSRQARPAAGSASGASAARKPAPNPSPPSGACATLKLDVFGSRAHVLQLRGWRAGDHYHPLGQTRDRKLKEMFQQARIPSWRRPYWPILALGAQIVWTRGFGVAVEFAASGAGAAVTVHEEARSGLAAK